MSRKALGSAKPDPDFGTNGLANLPEHMYAGNVMWTSGTLALVVGASMASTTFLVTRLGNDGNVDASFGDKGIIEGQILPEQISMGMSAYEVENNKTMIVVSTSSATAGFMPCVTRYTQEGTLDPIYGQDGVTQLPYPIAPVDPHPPETRPRTNPTPSTARLSGLTPSGELVVGWWYINAARTVIHRLDKTGKLDTTFNGVGYVTYPEALGHSSLSALLVLASGKTLALGVGRDGPVEQLAIFYPFLVRYTEAGALDSEFGTDGNGFVVHRMDDVANFTVNGCIETKAGGLIIFGRNSDDNARLIGLLSDGTIDPTFKSDNVPEVFQWLSAAYDGEKLVAAGHTSDPRLLIIARYNPDGTLDTGFGDESGWVSVDHPGIGSPTPYDVKAVNDRILIAGGDFVFRILA